MSDCRAIRKGPDISARDQEATQGGEQVKSKHRGTLKRPVHLPTIVQDGNLLILLVPVGNYWDKYVWRDEWIWDDRISNCSARIWMRNIHYTVSKKMWL